MLAELRLKNLLLIEEASLSFAPGFTVFTGETGAGKSLLVKALRLVLGERGSLDYVRPGAREAVVEALLVSPELPERLSALGFDPAEEVLIRRVLAPERSRAFVNGTPVPLRMLSELTRGLVILTGQHEFRALLSPEYRLRVLDTFAGLETRRKAYADLYREWRGVHEERTRLEGELLRAARERDFLEFQIREIEEADLSPGEDEALLREREILRNLTRLKAGLFEGSRALEEASEALSRALSSLRDLSRIEGELTPLLARLEEVYYELLEASRELSGRLSDLPEDDARLEEVEARLSRIENLKRKYGATVEEILSTLEELRRRREGLEVGEERLGELRSREKELAERVLSSALEISSARHSAARRLSRAMNRELEALALSGAEFRVEVETPAARPENLTPFGLDRVRFLVRTNPGTPARPLEKVVSRGELSRIFLALKSLLAERDRAACLVFDEVDAGIGGMVAVRVGEKLKELARREQVLCITHLPQIARLADHHFAVEKEVVDGLTYTRVRALGPEERERELRRMMGEADG